MRQKEIKTIKSISELHRIVGVAPPRHPSISFVKHSDMIAYTDVNFEKILLEFYVVSLKSNSGAMLYGRNYYDFEEGAMIFTAPNQVLLPTNTADSVDYIGWSLFFHPSLLYGSHLGDNLKKYRFFSYEANESLHLSKDEKDNIMAAVQNILNEYHQNLDKHSQPLIINNLELLLNYCLRFYDRQFLTRSNYNLDTISKVEKILTDYFDTNKHELLGIPTVKYCAKQVNLSPNYLSDLLKKATGKGTKEHIDYYLVEKAKTLLLTTSVPVSEVAFDLGFEYSQYFSKLFKKKTGFSPSQFRSAN